MSDERKKSILRTEAIMAQWRNALASLGEGPTAPTWEVWYMVTEAGTPSLFKLRQVRPSDRNYKKGLDIELDLHYEYVEAMVKAVEPLDVEVRCDFVQADTAEKAWDKIVAGVEKSEETHIDHQYLATLCELGEIANDEENDIWLCKRKSADTKEKLSYVWIELMHVLEDMEHEEPLATTEEILDKIEKELYSRVVGCRKQVVAVLAKLKELI